MKYTLAQLRGFTAAAARQDAERLADMATATRMAMGASPSDWQAYQAALRGDTQQPHRGNTNG